MTNISKKKVEIFRKMGPVLPKGIQFGFADEFLIIDFVGFGSHPGKREAFASLIVNESVAKNLSDGLREYLEKIKTN